MKFTTVIAAAASVAAVAADYGYYAPPAPVYNATGHGAPAVYTTTTVVSEYTTYCPYATTFTEGTKTYTVTEATTLTITNCPCTRTLTCTTTTSTSCPPTQTPVYTPPAPPASSAPAYIAPPASSAPAYVAPPPTNSSSYVPPPVATGAASTMKMASGALVAVFGAAALLL
ncbi:hypothetical protein ABW21_db0203378 [Orbilia brochopaga]|nr:hypothetical protein ABW21_db0203378 [Drechslerella brochopaga]